MTVLVGGLRGLGANFGGATHSVFADGQGTLINDFFVSLDMSTVWTASDSSDAYEGRDRTPDALRWNGTAVDLVFG